MTISVVQSEPNNNGASPGTSLTITLPSPTTAGNCVVVCVAAAGSGGTVSNVKLGGAAGNFAKAKGQTGGSAAPSDAEIWTDPGCAGGQTSVVITVSSSSYLSAVAYEVAGLVTSSPVDKTAAAPSSGTGSTYSSGSAAATSQAAEIWFGCLAIVTDGTLAGPASPPWVNTQSGEIEFIEAGYQIASATGTPAYSGTISGDSDDSGWACVVVTLLGGTSAPVTPAAGRPLIPPSPFTPMSVQFWQPPEPFVSAYGSAALAPMAVSGTFELFTAEQPGRPLIPPGPFTPMSIRFAPPPPVPYVNFTGSVALAPMAVSGQESPPSFSGSAALAPMAAAGTFSAHSVFPSAPLGTKVELLINGTWTDITSFVLYEQGIKITRGRPDETQSVTAAQCPLRVRNDDGRFSPSNGNGAYAPYLGRNTQIRVSVDAWVDVSGEPTEYDGFRFWGECASLKPGWDETGNFRYVDITAAGPIRRYSQGNATIGSALRRYYTRLAGSLTPYGYWPAEDVQGASEFASYIAGVPAMGFTGSPQLASNSAFGGSDAIPAVNSSSWHGQTLAASSPPGAGSITQITPGTYDWTCPPGVTEVTGVDTTGGGGGGGAAGPHAGGGGGGGAAQSLASSIGTTEGVTYQYVVGPGGQGGASIGAGGGPGGTSSWTGDTQACTAGGGQGGEGGDTSTGGAGGTGAHPGGDGGTGQESVTTSGSRSLQGNAGGTGGASGGTADQQTENWMPPTGVTSIFGAIGGGAGGGAGGGQDSNGTGGGGGGGGGFNSADIAVTSGTAVSIAAGNGGFGGNSAADGMSGAGSSITGAGSGITEIGVGGGSGGSAGSGGAGGPGGPGSPGGGSVKSEPGEGMGGGGGGGGGAGANGTGGTAGTTNDPQPPGAGGGNGASGGWGAQSNGGSGATNGGTGQNGSLGSSGGGGGGGGGAVTNTSGNAGGGGGAGWAYWSWSVTAPAGGGGGGAGGTTGAGGTGSNDGAGGSGGTGSPSGGVGGSQGNISPVGGTPGGGGGGGVPASATTTAAAAGNGAPGQVSFSWSGGEISPVAADIVRFLLEIDSAGGTDGAILARIITYGTVERMDLIYHTADGGSLELAGYNSGGTQLFDSGTVLDGLNGTPVMADIELTQNGTGGAVWSLAVIEPGADSALGTFTGTVSSVTVSNVSDVYISPDSDVSFASAGHIAVQTYADDLTVLAQVMAGYAGELAETRLARLCSEEGLTFTLVGPSGVTPQMQAQQDDTFPNVIQSCEDADRGLLFESRDSFGLTYRSRVSMQGQTPTLTLDYSLGQAAFPMTPDTDDQYTRNDIGLTRNNGSSATAKQATGPMSVLPPEQGGVGDYLYTLTVYVYQDSQLAPMAAWMLLVGTVADERFPVISVDMSRPEIVALFGTAAALDMGDYLQIVNPPSWLTSMPVQQLAWGMTETLSNFVWRLDFNAVPESPYSSGNPPTW